jgi:two-component system, OmpR family, response regulator
MSSILIVEDEERIASFVDKGLRSSGFATAIAGDGESGLAMATSGRFDLVVLDLGLPDIDGIEVLSGCAAGG